MNTLDYLGLDKNKIQPVVDGLAQLLADFQLYYSNLRGFHWNIEGKNFFMLHAKFEQLYNDAAEKVDEIAERMLQLGAVPDNKYSSYIKQATISEVSDVICGEQAVKNILESLSILIKQERALLEKAGEAGDEVTSALISDYLSGQEKQVWMLTAFMGGEACHV